jgi:membrane protein YfhO
MLGGKWLAGPFSDQVTAGLPFRGWGAEWWRRLGHVPLWNPEIFGGMPYVGALGTGDILYPTAFLRLILPTATVINIGFFVHYVLAGLFMYLLLRRLRVSWAGAVVGGLAYQLSGLVASYVQPGHDGKLVVTALLPLVLLGLVAGMQDRRLWGYGVTALGIGLSILTQHVQMTYYMLIAAGLFALYIALGPATATPADRARALGLATAAVALGFGIAAVQLLPAFVHMPLSSRAVGYQGGFAGSTSYGIPWMHIPEFFLKNFVGSGTTYWGSNPIKLHSEYLGLPVIALALLGARAGVGARKERSLRLWLAGIGLLFLLIGLGKGTPFYHVWWAVMPYVKQMRAPGMAFFVVAFVVSCFAAFGVERLERQRDDASIRVHLQTWLIAAGVLALLAAAGLFGNMAVAASGGQPVARGDIAFGAISSAAALAAVAALAWAGLRGRLAPARWTLLVTLVVGADLWLNAKPFWIYSTTDRELYRPDPVTERMQPPPSTAPGRALDLGGFLGPRPHAVYPGAVLMALDVPQLLGVHGIEIRYFDDVLGKQEDWRNVGNLRLWDLFAVRWVIVPAFAQGLDSLPGFTRVLREAMTSTGTPAHLFERTAPAPYVRVVPAAVKLDSAQILATLPDPRMAYDRIVLLDTRETVTPAAVTGLPAASPARATVTHWEPGRMSITLDPAPSAASYALVAENWYPDWHATVDGAPAPVLRGDWTLITVPVPAGAKRVELTFSSRAYGRGKAITWVSLLLVLGAVVLPVVRRRRGG